MASRKRSKATRGRKGSASSSRSPPPTESYDPMPGLNAVSGSQAGDDTSTVGSRDDSDATLGPTSPVSEVRRT